MLSPLEVTGIRLMMIATAFRAPVWLASGSVNSYNAMHAVILCAAAHNKIRISAYQLPRIQKYPVRIQWVS